MSRGKTSCPECEQPNLSEEERCAACGLCSDCCCCDDAEVADDEDEEDEDADA